MLSFFANDNLLILPLANYLIIIIIRCDLLFSRGAEACIGWLLTDQNSPNRNADTFQDICTVNRHISYGRSIGNEEWLYIQLEFSHVVLWLFLAHSGWCIPHWGCNDASCIKRCRASQDEKSEEHIISTLIVFGLVLLKLASINHACIYHDINV